MTTRRGRWRNWYPALVAGYPVLLIASGNVSENTIGELAAVYAAAVAAGALVHVATSGLWRRRASPEAIALAAASANFFLFCAFHVVTRVVFVEGRWVNPALALAAAAAIALASRAGQVPSTNTVRTSRLTGAFVLGLAAMACGTIAFGRARSARLYASSAVVDSLRAPLAPPLAETAPRPDVYLVILDGFPNDDVMRRVALRSTDPFVDSLRALGFVVPRVTRSNYSFTAQSVASLLNAGHVRGLETDFGADEQDRGVLYRLGQDNRVSRWFRASGYRVYVQPSISFPGTITNASATGTFFPPGRDALRFPFARSLLFRIFLEPTVPGRLVGLLGVDWRTADARLMPLRSLTSVARRPGPKLVIAHSLAAHPPFVLDSACAPLTTATHRSRPRRERFVGAAECTERLTLAAVREILAGAPRPPVILLQGDHGTELLGAPREGPPERVTPAQAYERMGAFGAYYLPGATLPDTVTPVNVFRYVLGYLGVPTRRLPDSSYFTTYEQPYHFLNVTPYLDAQGAPLASSADPARGRPPTTPSPRAPRHTIFPPWLSLSTVTRSPCKTSGASPTASRPSRWRPRPARGCCVLAVSWTTSCAATPSFTG